MELTERQAVELSIKLWEWLAETGRDKYEWPEWKENGGEFSKPRLFCFLCEYAQYNPLIISSSCELCPYFIKYKASCYEGNRPYPEWDGTKDKDIRKKYAKLFLNQLREILEDMEESKVESVNVGLSPFELLLTGFLEAVLEAFVEEKFDSECPHCQRMLNLPNEEDIEAWLKSGKRQGEQANANDR